MNNLKQEEPPLRKEYLRIPHISFLVFTACLSIWFVVLAAYSIDVPVSDDWDMIWYFMQYRQGDMTLDLLWRDYSGHRVPIGTMALILCGEVFKLNQSAFHLLNVLLLGCGAAVSIRLVSQVSPLPVGVRRSLLALQYCVFVVLVILSAFGFIQYASVFWAWQLQMFLCVILFQIAAFFAAKSNSTQAVRFLLVVLFCLLSTFTFGNGIVSWFACAGAWWISNGTWRKRLAGSLGLSAIGIAVLLVYVYRLGSGEPSDSSETEMTLAAWPIFHFIGNNLAFNYFPASFKITPFVGLASLAAFAGLSAAWYFYFRRESISKAAGAYFIGLGLFTVGSAVLMSLFRSVPMDDPMFMFSGGNSRYSTFGYFHWIAMFWLIFDISRQVLPQVERLLSIGSLTALTVLVLCSCVRSSDKLIGLPTEASNRRTFQKELREDLPISDEAMGLVALNRYSMDELYERNRFLRDNQLSFYRTSSREE